MHDDKLAWSEAMWQLDANDILGWSRGLTSRLHASECTTALCHIHLSSVLLVANVSHHQPMMGQLNTHPSNTTVRR